jgi:hypothetical protein
LVLKGQAELAAALRRLALARPIRSAYLAMRRVGVEATARSGALDLARRELTKKDADSDPKSQANSAAARKWAYCILSAWGEDEDAARLARAGASWVDIAVAARIEARLGTISRGHVAALLDQPGRSEAADAALELHEAGVRKGDDWLRHNVILAAADDGSGFLDYEAVWYALLQFSPEETRPAFLNQLERYRKRAIEIDALTPERRKSEYNQHGGTLFPILLFFLFNGGDELKALADIPVQYTTVPSLSFFTLDPSRLVPFFFDTNSRLIDAAELSALLAAGGLLLPSEERRGYVDALQTAVYRASYPILAARPELIRPVIEATASAYGAYLAEIAAFAHPSKSAAKYLAQQNDQMLPLTSWIPEPWKDEEYLDLLLGGDAFESDRLDTLLDTMPPRRFEEILARKGDAGKGYPFDLYAAHHKVVDRANFAFPGWSEGGYFAAALRGETDARPYVFGRKEDEDQSYAGGLAGLLSLRPERIGDRIALHLRLDQQAYYDFDGGFLELRQGDVTKWAAHAFTLDGGRPLIAAVCLFRDEAEIAVSEGARDQDGNLLFEATQPGPDLVGLTAVVELRYFDQLRAIGFDLFASDYAARLRAMANR